MNNKTIGSQMKKFRELNGLQLKQIAGYLDIDEDTMQKMEEGNSQISADQLEKLADLYFTDIDSFFNPDIEIKPIKFPCYISPSF